MAARKPALATAYATLAAAAGFAVGDKVKVLRSFKNDELGCGLDYDKDYMDNYIGDELEITNTFKNGTTFEVDDNYEWPFFCLEKVNDPLVVLNINGEYDDAEIAENGQSVSVGCNTITFEKVEAVYNAMVAQRAKVAAKPKAVAAVRRRR